MQPADQPVEQQEEQGLAGEQGGQEGADLERRVERLRLAEAAAEQGIFALGQRQLEEQGERGSSRAGSAAPRAAQDRRGFALAGAEAISTCIARILAARA